MCAAIPDSNVTSPSSGFLDGIREHGEDTEACPAAAHRNGEGGPKPCAVGGGDPVQVVDPHGSAALPRRTDQPRTPAQLVRYRDPARQLRRAPVGDRPQYLRPVVDQPTARRAASRGYRRPPSGSVEPASWIVTASARAVVHGQLTGAEPLGPGGAP